MGKPNIRPRLLAGALLTTTLALGIALGVVLDRTVLAPAPVDAAVEGAAGETPAAERERGPERPAHERIGRRWMVEELTLTAEQEEQVEEILERRQDEIDRIMGETRPRTREVIRETHREIMDVLTPEQRERLEKRFPRPGRGDRSHRARPDRRETPKGAPAQVRPAPRHDVVE